VVFTVLILLSEIPNLWTKAQAKAYRDGPTRLGLVLMSVIGVVLLGVRWMEFGALNTRWDADPYGSIIWALMFLHTVHVITDLGDTVFITVVSFTHRSTAITFPASPTTASTGGSWCSAGCRSRRWSIWGRACCDPRPNPLRTDPPITSPPWRAWAGLFGGFAGWALHHQIGSSSNFARCSTANGWLVIAVGLVACLIIVASGALSWTAWRRGGGEATAATRRPGVSCRPYR
jgi:hypothetical protein